MASEQRIIELLDYRCLMQFETQQGYLKNLHEASRKDTGAVREAETFWRGIQTGHYRQSQLALEM